MKKAYGFFDVKSVDEDKRIITGVAATITPDRVEDIMEPGGAQFKLPLPLLSQHDHESPIGEITKAEVTAKEILVEGHISKDTGLDYVEWAWKQLKARLVKGLSIGYRILEYSHIKDSYGLHVKEWEWYELSAVTVAANAECTITSIKAYDQDAELRSKVAAMSGVHPEIERALALQKLLKAK